MKAPGSSAAGSSEGHSYIEGMLTSLAPPELQPVNCSGVKQISSTVKESQLSLPAACGGHVAEEIWTSHALVLCLEWIGGSTWTWPLAAV